MREVFNLFSFDSIVQVKRLCYFTDYKFIFSQEPELSDEEECKELDRFLVKESV